MTRQCRVVESVMVLKIMKTTVSRFVKVYLLSILFFLHVRAFYENTHKLDTKNMMCTGYTPTRREITIGFGILVLI